MILEPKRCELKRNGKCLHMKYLKEACNALRETKCDKKAVIFSPLPISFPMP